MDGRREGGGGGPTWNVIPVVACLMPKVSRGTTTISPAPSKNLGQHARKGGEGGGRGAEAWSQTCQSRIVGNIRALFRTRETIRH